MKSTFTSRPNIILTKTINKVRTNIKLGKFKWSIYGVQILSQFLQVVEHFTFTGANVWNATATLVKMDEMLSYYKSPSPNIKALKGRTKNTQSFVGGLNFIAEGKSSLKT